MNTSTTIPPLCFVYALNNPLSYTDPSGNNVRPFENQGLGGGSNYDFDDNTDLYGNPIRPPGSYIAGFMSNSAGNFSSGPSFEEVMASNGNVYMENQYGIGSWVRGNDIRSFSGEYAWMDAMMYYNSLFPKEHFSDYYSSQDAWDYSLTASDGPGISVGLSHDVNLTLGGIGGTFEHGDIFSMPGNFHSFGNTVGAEISYSVNLMFLLKKPNYKSGDFFGLSSEFDFNIPSTPLSISISSNNSQNVFFKGNDYFKSYFMIKIGLGPGVGGSLTPNSNTRRNYFFYGDPSPGRIYWNPTSR